MLMRKLRILAFDPSLGRKLETSELNQITIQIPWEMDDIAPRDPFLGPAGEYVEVVDYDPSSGLFYDPINLHEPKLLAENGVSPNEGDPQFHQQMVYAVAMATIANFEEALGRVALWAPRLIRDKEGRVVGEEFVRQLRIYPHALREANAYYSPSKKALLFGYFEADDQHASIVPGSTIFTCLSHDVIAHETTHALLDGVHPRWTEATNPDIRALHEAFADVVALLQHFSHSDVLLDQVAKTRGDLSSENLLAHLAQEFGLALGRGGALRDALGAYDDDGVWRRHQPDRNAIHERQGPHGRGAILIAAVFQAFINIYNSRTADLLRIATNGTGILPEGALQGDLVKRMASEAARTASHLLLMCIRALDYCPPVDVNFGDYLRALLTADHDLFPDDSRNYRVAVLEAFISWGLVPEGRRTYSTQTLLWPTLGETLSDQNGEQLTEELVADVGLLISDPSRIYKRMQARDELGDEMRRSLREKAEEISKLLNESEDKKIFKSQIKELSWASDESIQTLKTQQRSREEVRKRYDLQGEREKYTPENILSRNLLELGLGADRKVEWLAREFYALLFWGILTDRDQKDLAQAIGLTTDAAAPPTVYRSARTGLPAIEVHSVRMAIRRGTRGQTEREYVVEVTQRRRGYLDREEQQRLDQKSSDFDFPPPDFKFRRGCTLLIDARNFRCRRVVRTEGSVSDDEALEKVRSYLEGRRQHALNAFDEGESPLACHGESFAALHRHIESD